MIGFKFKQRHNSRLLPRLYFLRCVYKIYQNFFTPKGAIVGILVMVCLFGNLLTFRLWQARLRSPTPQAIFILGGSTRRIEFAIKLAQRHPDLKIIISDYPIVYRISQGILKSANIRRDRVVYDFCATDTVTNFTCTLKFFEDNNLTHLYLVTSDYHMARALSIGTIIFGTYGIVLTPVKVPSFHDYSESKLQLIRDNLRSVFWLLTHQTGAELNPRIEAMKVREEQFLRRQNQ